MSEETPTQTLKEGVRYTASLQLTVTGGSKELEIVLERSPKEYLEGDENDVIEMPISYIIMDEIVDSILKHAEPEAAVPHLRLVH